MENSINTATNAISNMKLTEIKLSLFAVASTLAFILMPCITFAESVVENIVEFTYAGQPGQTSTTNAPHFEGGAMLLPKTLTSSFDGCRIVEVEIANGRFEGQNEAPIDIFFSNDLNQTPFYTFKGEMDIDRPTEYKSYPLEQPVQIVGGEEMYIGFVVWSEQPSPPDYKANYPIYTDGVSHTDKPGGFIGLSFETGAPEQMTWTDEGYSRGQVCMKLKIAGEHMPVDIVELNSVRMPNYVKPSLTGWATLEIYNRGVNDMNSVDVSYTVGDEVTTVHVEPPYPIGYSEQFVTGIDVSIAKEGLNIPIQFSVRGVNGNEITPADNLSKTCFVHSFAPEIGFPHNMVVEEGGGVGCGWCVRGIIGLDYTFNNHPDGSFIPISVHSREYIKEISPIGYDALWDRYLTHIPNCLINRDLGRFGIVDPNMQMLMLYYHDATSTPAIAKLEVSDYHFVDNELIVSSEIEFALDGKGTQYAVAYVVTEDNVGPYMQSNAYSGSHTSMEGWENLPEYVETYYDFLARGISDFDGTIDGIPLDVEQGIQYRHSGAVSLERTRDLNQLHVIAMLINRATGIIENGTRQKLSYEASISPIATDFVEEEYFDLQGRKITNPTRPGLYLCRRAGRTDKILIK